MFGKPEVVIAVGSTSSQKIDAVGRAFYEIYNGDKKYFWQRRKIRVIGLNASSGVNEQPWGYEEGFKGAYNRLDQAKERMRRDKRRHDYVIGIENTLIPVGTSDFDRQLEIFELPRTQETKLLPEEFWDMRFADIACVVVEDNLGNQQEEASADVIFPAKYVRKAIESGFRIPAGNFIAEDLNGDGADPHMTLVHKPRSEFIKDAIIEATKKLPARR